MERKIILNFVSSNYKILKAIDFHHLNIYLYGKSYAKNSISSYLLNGEQIFAYDVTLPRTFCKKFSFDKMSCGILDFASQIDNNVCFSKSDFSFELEDVYSGKDISEFDFNYLYLVPIIKENIKVGLIVIYAKNKIDDFNLINSSITVLYNSLQEIESKSFEQVIINSLIDYDNYYYILRENLLPEVVLSTSLKDKWQKGHKISFKNELVQNFMNHHLVKEKKLEFPFEQYKIFYINKNEFDDQSSRYLHINALSSINLPDEFTLLVVDFSQNNDDFVNVVNNMHLIHKYYLCAYEEDYYLLIIESKINQSLFKKILKSYDCYYLVINAPKDLNNKMDFRKIASYIKNNRPKEFEYQNYLKYINDVNNDLLEINFNEYKTKEVVCSFGNKKIANLINFIPNKFKFDSSKIDFEKRTINRLNSYIKNNNENVFVCLNASSIIKRKIIEIYKKYFSKDINLSVIITYQDDLSKKEFLDAIAYAKQYNVSIFVDSSIFLNLELIDLMRYFDGCYVKKEEFASIQNAPNKFINVFVSYYFNDNKTIIFEETNNRELNKRYEDELIYFVKESEGRKNGKCE